MGHRYSKSRATLKLGLISGPISAESRDCARRIAPAVPGRGRGVPRCASDQKRRSRPNQPPKMTAERWAINDNAPRRVASARRRCRALDFFTSGGDYGRDTLNRAGWFRLKGWA